MAFAIARSDGRSNQQVVIDHVKDAPPGTLFSYDDLGTVLGSLEKLFPRLRIGQAVRQANLRLLKEQQRELVNVRGQGYRIALAREHSMLASGRERRADRQIQRGLTTLRHVRLEEMNENERTAHMGHLMVTSGLAANMMALRRRQNATDKVIATLTKRIEELEQ